MREVSSTGKSEAAVQADTRLAASRNGGILWRNNVGVARDESGRVIRFGLCNDSAPVNRHTKSSDLIGITPVTITPDMVGTTVGIFTAVECKAEGWKFAGTVREKAQRNFIMIVNALGGIARFENGT